MDLVEIDPSWTLEMLEKAAINDPEEKDSLRNREAVVLARESPDDAAALVEMLPIPERRRGPMWNWPAQCAARGSCSGTPVG